MSVRKVNRLVDEVMSNMVLINRISARLTESIKRDIFKEDIHLRNIDPPELGFLRTVSWLYVQYVECARFHLPTLTEIHEKNFDKGEADESYAHIKLIKAMRHYFQHYLNPLESNDRKKIQLCEEWFKRSCGGYIPVEAKDWSKALVALLEEAKRFMNALKTCLTSIEDGPDRVHLVEQWSGRVNRQLEPMQFDDIISGVAANYGIKLVQHEVEKFRNANHGDWNRRLQRRAGLTDTMLEARKLVEQTLLFNYQPNLPITTQDIIDKLGISPGYQIKLYMARAYLIFVTENCLKDELLEKLASENIIPSSSTV